MELEAVEPEAVEPTPSGFVLVGLFGESDVVEPCGINGLELVCPLGGEFAVFDPVEPGIIGPEIDFSPVGPRVVDSLGMSGLELVCPLGEEFAVFDPAEAGIIGPELDVPPAEPSVVDPPGMSGSELV